MLLADAIIATLFLTSAVESRPAKHALAPAVCSQSVAERKKIKALIRVSSDMHGSAGRLVQCPEVGFGLDFSKSNLFDRKHEKLLSELQASAMSLNATVDMQVTGYFETVQQRRMLIVTRIHS
ncbi:MAG: hypothetical protein A2095_10340 [Sphingomonadales bacterium GWF1_63_6]|jgi:hypothetical protein|nr:MAG: hypothetical protein A2095_10340 [Sphingomonadales bacterium GWF1_63_6]